MFEFVFSIILSFAITFFSIPAIITISKLKKLYDLPDERKIHQDPIVSLGGVGIFAGFSLSILFCGLFHQLVEFQYILAAVIIIFFLGIKDDILVISPLKKFIGQSMAALLMILKGGMQIRSFHGFLGVNELGFAGSIIFTFLAVILIINSFNLIDGVDGLAASLGLMAGLIFGSYFLLAGETAYALISFCLCGSLAAFLLFNFQPARIFMGDTGSLLIGTVCSILVVRFINSTGSVEAAPWKASPAIGFSILIIPLMDAIRVFGLRILDKRSPFKGDRCHIHHLLVERGMSHRKITYLLLLANAICISIAWLASGLGTSWIVVGLIAVYFFAIWLITWFPVVMKDKTALVTNREANVEMKAVGKMVVHKKIMAE